MGGAIQGVGALALTNPVNVSTFAGSAVGYINSTIATGAKFNHPIAITTDGTNLYVADYNNNAIRQIVIASGNVTTLAGNVNGLIGSADGTGSAASFNRPSSITTDGTSLYVTDSGNYTIRKIVISTGAVTTLAGYVGVAGSIDATGSNARFNILYGITTDGTNLYVTDSNNTIRMIVISSGAVTTTAGTAGTIGTADGTQAAARFNQPARITTDGANLYVTDFNNRTIRKIVIGSWVVTTMAGVAGQLGTDAGTTDGIGTAAHFNQPNGITTDGTNLYVTDSYNNTIRKIVIGTGAVTTISGSAGTVGYVDTTGGTPSYNTPVGITSDGINLYVADSGNQTIRKLK
jgi:sugar lactone lactonase YvrE